MDEIGGGGQWTFWVKKNAGKKKSGVCIGIVRSFTEGRGRGRPEISKLEFLLQTSTRIAAPCLETVITGARGWDTFLGLEIPSLKL